MNITWYGQTCFKIEVQRKKEGQVSIITDLFENEIGLRAPKAEADIFLFSQNNKRTIPDSSFLALGPGEYDVKDVYIQGISTLAESGVAKTKSKSAEQNTIYIIETEDIKICHLGKLFQSELNPKELEEIGEVDILMVPVGGRDALDAKGAIKIMSQIEPKITIPMYYKVPGLKTELDGLDKFLKSLGIKTLDSLPKLSIKKKDLPEDEEAKIIVLQS